MLFATNPSAWELRKGARSAVRLADRAIGNLQQRLIAAYHGVSTHQLQVYLDEFVFRHNRRKTPAAAFQTLLGPQNRLWINDQLYTSRFGERGILTPTYWRLLKTTGSSEAG